MAAAAFRRGHGLWGAVAAAMQRVGMRTSWQCGYFTVRRGALTDTIYPMSHPSISLSPELDRWAETGKAILPKELEMLVYGLRRQRRNKQALEVSEWMQSKGNVAFLPAHHAVQLDLIGKVRGLAFAEAYFDSMHEKDKTEKTYGALLNCFVREGLTEKALSHMQEMKKMGIVTSSFSYNNIMSLYSNTGRYSKVPTVFVQMKIDGFSPDTFSYRICINALGRVSDIGGMEEIIKEMENRRQVVMDWNTYSVVASIYIREGITDKAIFALRKAENMIEKKNGLFYNYLISLFCQLGKKSEMWRIWELQESNGNKFINKDYKTMLRALVKLGELEESHKLLTRWEASGNAYDFRVPNILLLGYSEKGLFDKAEAMIDGMLMKDKTLPASSWGILAYGYAAQDQMAKVHEFMKKALGVYVPKQGWEPDPKIVKNILNWLVEEGDPDDVDAFINLLKVSMPMNFLKSISSDEDTDKIIQEKLSSVIQEASA